MIPETSDGRVLFAVPWHDKVVVGTTDTPVADASLEPIALEILYSYITNSLKQVMLQDSRNGKNLDIQLIKVLKQ